MSFAQRMDDLHVGPTHELPPGQDGRLRAEAASPELQRAILAQQPRALTAPGNSHQRPVVLLAEERSLLEGITAYRAAFTGRDPVAPPAHWDGQRYHVRFPDGSVRTLDPPAQPVVPVPVMLLPTYR